MAKVIEFYIPSSFRKKEAKWILPESRGKVIPFGVPQRSQPDSSETPRLWPMSQFLEI